jgi:phage head maturation protease
MKKRIVNKYFSQIKKGRRNVRLKRKIGRKEMTYLYEHRKDIFPDNVWGKLLKMMFDSKGLFGIFTIRKESKL